MKKTTHILAVFALALWALWLTYNVYEARIYTDEACRLATDTREFARKAAWLHELPLPSQPVHAELKDRGILHDCDRGKAGRR